ncbi:POC1 centriolar protein A [Pleurotus pulmonarius]|nr:POC1 centriolar protein A [Pleurotus pulmonarius]
MATGLIYESKWCIPVRSKPNVYVAIKWMKWEGSQPEHQEHQTKVVKGTTSPEWKETVKLVYVAKNAMISFEMFDKGLVHRHSYGIVRKAVSELLATPRLDIPFPPHEAVLSIMTKREAPDSIASGNLAAAQEAIHGMVQVPDTPEINVSPYEPLKDVVDSLDKIMKIADAFAEIHPFVKVVWSVVFSVYKVIKDQLERDVAIRELLETMAMLYSQGVLLKVERNQLSNDVANTLEQILRQTIECSLFIQEYSGEGFAGQAIRNSFANRAGAKIQQFKQAFDELRKQLDMGVNIQTSLISIRIVRRVEDMALKSYLNPAEMIWTSRTRCHPLTRLAIQDEIMAWILDPNASKMLWITGLVGAGKSTLATTVADVYAKTTLRLGAFVFFNRDVEERNNPDNFVRTLAYELSKCDDRVAKGIKAAVDRSPRIVQMPLDAQFRDLIRVPLVNAASNTPGATSLANEGPIIIVIDSLDECGNEFTRKDLLTVLVKETANLSPVVRVILTSRPEPDICATFSNKEHIKHQELKVIPHDNDIHIYLKAQLKDIEVKHDLKSGWPGESRLLDLAARADGLFIWASTACKYIDTYRPDEALVDLLQDGFYKGLDNLYNKALEHAGDWNNIRLRKDFQSILGTIMVARKPMASKTIDKFIKLTHPSKDLLSKLASVIHEAENGSIRIFHKSFSEFVTNPKRCKDCDLLIDISHHEYCTALNCIAQMEAAFEALPQFTLGRTPEVSFNEAVAYSCSYWIHHVIAVEGEKKMEMALAVYDLLRVHTMHWLETASILNVSHYAPSMLDQLSKWAMGTGMGDLKALAYDAYRFTSFFAATIAEHPAMITQVALPFVPLETQLH